MASVSFSDMTEIDDTDWDIGSTEMINERDSPLLIQGKSKLLYHFIVTWIYTTDSIPCHHVFIPLYIFHVPSYLFLSTDKFSPADIE